MFSRSFANFIHTLAEQIVKAYLPEGQPSQTAARRAVLAALQPLPGAPAERLRAEAEAAFRQ
jgi:hypothetical protein